MLSDESTNRQNANVRQIRLMFYETEKNSTEFD
jgi:hypothetical protein